MFSRRFTLRSFARDDRGSIAIMFGLTSISLILAVGIAIDMGIALHARTRLSQAVDSAALSAAKASREHNLDDAKTEALARSYVDAIVKDMSDVLSTLQTPTIKVDSQTSTIEIKLQAIYKTRFGGLVSLYDVPVEAEGSARIDGNDIEVAMGLDVTGSMLESQGGTTRIAALKSAAVLAVETLIPETPGKQKVRVAIAPYSSGVNAGAFAGQVNGGRNTNGSGGTCVFERRQSALDATDVAPSGAAGLKIIADLPSTPPPATEGPRKTCPGSANRVVPLTESRQPLIDAIGSLSPTGATAGHFSAMWSWYLLSPNWSSVWGGTAAAPYNDGKTIKAAIMMTDGDFNTINGWKFADNDPQSDNVAIAACNAMRQQNIVIYTIGFGDSLTSQAENTLKSCASDVNKFYLAKNQADLEAAFKTIAKDITSLRLTK